MLGRGSATAVALVFVIVAVSAAPVEGTALPLQSQGTTEPSGQPSSGPDITLDVVVEPEDSRQPGKTLADGHMRRLTAAVEGGQLPKTLSEVADDGSILVEIVHDKGVLVDDLVEQNGGTVRSSSLLGMTLADVPFGVLLDLELEPTIKLVRRPTRVDVIPDSADEIVIGPTDPRAAAIGAVTGEHVLKTNADAWLAAGITGDGVRIGIVDSFDAESWNAALAAGELKNPVSTFCRYYGNACSVGWKDSTHGVMVAEVVLDMAPDAEIFLASVGSPNDLADAVAWLIDQDVDIITRSLGAQLDGPGNGTGFMADLQKLAVDAGILWLNSAGNHAGSATSGNAWADPTNPLEDGDGGHWRGVWSDTDNDGWLNIDGSSSELFVISCTTLFFGLRWDDFTAADPTDYDMWIWNEYSDGVKGEPVKYDDAQGAGFGAPPIEQPTLTASPPTLPCEDYGYVGVQLYDPGGGATGDVLQFFTHHRVDPWTNPYSATQAFADTASAGGMAVGAIDPWNGVAIASYSSRGPTNDGRITPTLSAASCVAVFTPTVKGCFNGTSAATPAVAGAAALVLSAGIATTPATIKEYLLDATVERGPVGPDNTYGQGELVLPNPPVDSTAPTWGAQANLDLETFETHVELGWPAASDESGVAEYIVVRAPGIPVGGVYQGTVIATLGPGARSYTATGLSPQTPYAFWVEAADQAGNQSSDGPLGVTTTATNFTDTNGSVFHDDIAWLSANEITKGCNPPANTQFCPDDPVTRGQMAAFLVRALGLIGGENLNFFGDDDDSVFESNINTLAFYEITVGCNPPANDRFCPEAPTIRSQMASFLARALLLLDGWNINYFIDDELSVHEHDINRLAHSGITKGCNPPLNTLFCPGSTVTRGQMAAFLHRARDEINAVRALIGVPPVQTPETAAKSISP